MLLSRTIVSSLLIFTCLVPAASWAAEHPYVLWTADDLAAMKQLIETEDWAKAQWERKPSNDAEKTLRDLLDYRLFGNEEAGQRQKKHLLSKLRTDPPLGGAQWLNVLRYDLAHDLLSEDERTQIEGIFRDYIRTAIHENALTDPEVFNDERNFSRYDATAYTLRNWLPNITWPRRLSANLMAAALGDEELIRETWDRYGSFRWYMDQYLTEAGFYGEEFSKQGATVGEMILYCEALENLGLNALGYGYTGRHGATMKGHLASFMTLSYPIVELHSYTPHIPMITMGDLRQSGSSRRGNLPTRAFQHSAVQGYLPGETAEERTIHRWQGHGAWGGEVRGKHPQWDGYTGFVPKMMVPFWFEVGHARWPDMGFDWFLSQLREPGQQRYQPSLYFGVEPIAPDDAAPPHAQNWIAPRRGMAMLRATEGPDHWASPDAAVSMRLATEYAHSVHDSFAIMGYYALNRPMLLNRQATPGYAKDWSRSIASHNAVRVDGQEPRTTDDVQTRHWFEGPIKMFSATSDQVYPGVSMTRILMLVGHDLIDIVDLRDLPGGKETHDYEYLVHALGHHTPDPDVAWQDAEPLGGTLAAFGPMQHMDGFKLWSVRLDQQSAHDDAALNTLPAAWYERKVGLRITGNGGPTTAIYLGPTPLRDQPADAPGIEESPEAYEVGGTSIIVRRPGQTHTTFKTYYQPFDIDNPATRRLATYRTDSDRVLAMQLLDRDSPVVVWMLVEIAPGEEPVTFAAPDGGPTVTFRGHAFIQLSPQRIDAWGFVQRLEAAVDGDDTPLHLNGRLTRGGVRISDGRLLFAP